MAFTVAAVIVPATARLVPLRAVAALPIVVAVNVAAVNVPAIVPLVPISAVAELPMVVA